jgi:hypothetical protein
MPSRLLTLYVVAWSGVCVLSVRRLWRKTTSPKERVIYVLGARNGGLGCWLAYTLLLPLHEHAVMSREYWIGVAEVGFLGFPFWIWLGWLMGRVAAALLESWR